MAAAMHAAPISPRVSSFAGACTLSTSEIAMSSSSWRHRRAPTAISMPDGRYGIEERDPHAEAAGAVGRRKADAPEPDDPEDRIPQPAHDGRGQMAPARPRDPSAGDRGSWLFHG